jgi:hypothetical protein
MSVMVIDNTAKDSVTFSDLEKGDAFKCGSSVMVKCSPMRAFDFNTNEIVQIKHDPAVTVVGAQLRLFTVEQPRKKKPE